MHPANPGGVFCVNWAQVILYNLTILNEALGGWLGHRG